MKNIAIFASGKGSNADNICRYFANHSFIRVALIVSDRKSAGVFEIAKFHSIETLYINKEGWDKPEALTAELQKRNIYFIVLAGFLKLIPAALIKIHNNKIINIHPSLLPKFGGKGMFGMHVHEAVKIAGEKETGISIHFVNEQYDDGNIIFQAKTKISSDDTTEIIAQKIHQLEMNLFPKVIEDVILKSINPNSD